MRFSLLKIHHLVRYFILLAAGAFAAYLQPSLHKISLILIGPSLYLANGLKKGVVDYIWSIPPSQEIDQYGFVLPITLIYFGLLGFQIKQLWNERGLARTLTLTAFIFFLLFIHFTAWKNLTLYLT